MEKDKEFNLLDEAWIRVIYPDCREKEVSLLDLFRHAHEYEGLAGETSAQNTAVLRVLLAILHAVFEHTDAEGRNSPLESEDDAYSRWKELWDGKRFPEKPIETYLEQWRDHFWLFHPERPFFQFAEAASVSKYGAEKLNGEISESGNKTRLFSPRDKESRNYLSIPEAARWLLYLNGFDDGAVKPSERDKALGVNRVVMGISWLGELGLIESVGDNLFETLMLNLVLLDKDQEPWESAEPIWEKDPFTTMICRKITPGSDQAELLTIQSRRILLIKNGDKITGYHINKGDCFDKQNFFLEQMTLWRKQKDKKTEFYVPKQHHRERRLWQEFSSIAANVEGERSSGVVRWVNRLVAKQLLVRPLIKYRSVGVRYDSSQNCSITDIFEDSLSFHSEILLTSGSEWIDTIEDEVSRCDELAKMVAWFAVQLALAGGEKQDNYGDKEKEQFFYRVDIPFREWLLKLDPSQGDTERISLREEWRTQAYQIADDYGKELVKAAGPTAFKGRLVKRNDNDPGFYYAAPKAYGWFKYKIGMWRKGEQT